MARGIWSEAVPVTGLAENFSPMPRIAPPPLGSDGMGTLGPEAALDAEDEPALLPALGGAAFGSSDAMEEGLFLGSFPERRSTIALPRTRESGHLRAETGRLDVSLTARRRARAYAPAILAGTAARVSMAERTSIRACAGTHAPR